MKKEFRVYQRINRMVFKRIIKRLVKLGKLQESGKMQGACYSFTCRFDYFECYPNLMEFEYIPASEPSEIYRVRKGVVYVESRNKTNIATLNQLAKIYDLLMKCKN